MAFNLTGGRPLNHNFTSVVGAISYQVKFWRSVEGFYLIFAGTYFQRDLVLAGVEHRRADRAAPHDVDLLMVCPRFSKPSAATGISRPVLLIRGEANSGFRFLQQ